MSVVGSEWPLIARVSASKATESVHVDVDVELEEMSELEDRSIRSWANVAMNQILALVDEKLYAKDEPR
ncbi:hypothetical protein [Blastococcus sp. SYSU DS0619]